MYVCSARHHFSFLIHEVIYTPFLISHPRPKKKSFQRSKKGPCFGSGSRATLAQAILAGALLA